MAWLLLAVCTACKVFNVVCGLLSWQLYAYKRRIGKLPQSRLEHTLTIDGTGNPVGTSGNIQLTGIDNAALDTESKDL